MQESYIKDYQIKLLEDVYNDDLERLKAIYYGLDFILNSLQYNQETNEDAKNYNILTTCFLQIGEIIKENDTTSDIDI